MTTWHSTSQTSSASLPVHASDRPERPPSPSREPSAGGARPMLPTTAPPQAANAPSMSKLRPSKVPSGSNATAPGWRNGRRSGLKSRGLARGVRVRAPPRALLLRQHLLDRRGHVRRHRLHLRGEARHRLALGVDEELGEVPLHLAL